MSNENKTNILKFPNISTKVIDEPDLAEIDNNILFAKQYHIEESMNFLSQMILEHLMRLGINITEESDFKDLALILDSIRSYISKKYNILHIFQIISNEYVIKLEKENNEEYAYELDIKKLSNKLKNKNNKNLIDLIGLQENANT